MVRTRVYVHVYSEYTCTIWYQCGMVVHVYSSTIWYTCTMVPWYVHVYHWYTYHGTINNGSNHGAIYW